MARRKKVPEGYHREQIANMAAELFQEKGMTTSMDELARYAGYSKATIYVYFTDKNEIIDELSLRSMRILETIMQEAIQSHQTTKERYFAICRKLEEYHVLHPLYFDLASKSIRFDTKQNASLPYEIYMVGEAILNLLRNMIEDGKATLELREDIEVVSCVFTIWASILGVIVMVDEKQRYIEEVLKLSKEQFLIQCFETIYESISRR